MKKNELKVGDTVKLNSGGPTMTVSIIDIQLDSERVECMWIVEGEVEWYRFYPETLKKVS